ncbi:MAG: YabP/YqfC family sporulation protein [Clostridia bacterium]|nr:YabP/YqfC family sporulation protein [Clostridia bacterium]
MEDIKTASKPCVRLGTHIEIDSLPGGASVSVYGVKNIVDFGAERAVLLVKGGKILIKGVGLSISVYENRIVEIFGKISGVEFL